MAQSGPKEKLDTPGDMCNISTQSQNTMSTKIITKNIKINNIFNVCKSAYTSFTLT